MIKAADLVRTCMADGRLIPELNGAIPLASRGDFLRALEVLKSASGVYHAGRRPEVQRSLSVVVTMLRCETLAEADETNSPPSITALAEMLTPVQQRILDVVWAFYIDQGQPYPIRSLQPLIGRVSLSDALAGLSRRLVYEIQEQGARSVKLTLVGALITGHGRLLRRLLTRLMDYVRQRYEADSLVREIPSTDIENELQISPDESRLLFRALSLGLPRQAPAYLGGYNLDGSSWTVSVTDDVISLYQTDDTSRFVEELLLKEYNESGASHSERLRHHLSDNPSQGPFASDVEPARAFLLTPAAASAGPYVSLSRLAEMSAIQNANFDCSRLICLCEELNAAASLENAHSVIMLTRTILNHVPPVFGFRTFAEVANNYSSAKSLKPILMRLEDVSRKIADRLMHMPIEPREVAPNMTQVNFSAELDVMLSELCRRLK